MVGGQMRKRSLASCVTVLLLACGAPGARGAAPLPLHVDLVNRSSTALECHAIAGHWYGFDLGTIAVDARTPLPLSLDRATGTISMPNSLRQAVPIQWIYCGRSGDAWRTRAVLPLRSLEESNPPPSAIVCRDGKAALRCE